MDHVPVRGPYLQAVSAWEAAGFLPMLEAVECSTAPAMADAASM